MRVRGDGAVTRRHPHAVSLTLQHVYYDCQCCCGSTIAQLNLEGDVLVEDREVCPTDYSQRLTQAKEYSAKFDLPLIEDPEERDLIMRCW